MRPCSPSQAAADTGGGGAVAVVAVAVAAGSGGQIRIQNQGRGDSKGGVRPHSSGQVTVVGVIQKEVSGPTRQAK